MRSSDPRSELPRADISRFLQAALQMVDETAPITMGYFGRPELQSETKEDHTPVTEADLAAERLLRDRIMSQFPEHGIIGEELEDLHPNAELKWTIDPIDGTRCFANQIPTFGTMLSLRFRDRPVLGVIDHPALGIRVAAQFGGPVLKNGKPITVRRLVDGTGPIERQEILVTGNRECFNRGEDGKLFDKLHQWHPIAHIYYDCFGHTLAIQGSVAAFVEFNVKIWDVSPTELMIEAGGGRYVEIKRERQENGPDLICAVFGRPGAVQSVLEQIA